MRMSAVIVVMAMITVMQVAVLPGLRGIGLHMSILQSHFSMPGRKRA
ncbi:hypothetical protein [Musicola keenii]|nr:hypothetical protein [Musicola keenii]